VITGAVDLQGNRGPSQTTGDLVENNSFASAAPVILRLTNSTGTAVRDNTFVGDASSQVGIQVRSNSDQVLIANNRVELTGAGQPIAVYLLNTGGAAGNILGARVLVNTLSTGGHGTGLYVNIFGTGPGMPAEVEGTEFHGNKDGVEGNGITTSATGAGHVDLGEGSNSFGISKGGNTFRGYDGQTGHFAIYLHNTDAGITLPATSNIFDFGIDTHLGVRDGANAGGSGTVPAGALNRPRAFVQNLYTKLLGRAGDPAPGGELAGWVAVWQSQGQAAVVHAILYSQESLERIVGR